MERTDPETPQDSPEPPSESSVVSVPATVEACADDYAAGAAIRKSLDDRVRRHQR